MSIAFPSLFTGNFHDIAWCNRDETEIKPFVCGYLPGLIGIEVEGICDPLSTKRTTPFGIVKHPHKTFDGVWNFMEGIGLR